MVREKKAKNGQIMAKFGSFSFLLGTGLRESTDAKKIYRAWISDWVQGSSSGQRYSARQDSQLVIIEVKFQPPADSISMVFHQSCIVPSN